MSNNHEASGSIYNPYGLYMAVRMPWKYGPLYYSCRCSCKQTNHDTGKQAIRCTLKYSIFREFCAVNLVDDEFMQRYGWVNILGDIEWKLRPGRGNGFHIHHDTKHWTFAGCLYAAKFLSVFFPRAIILILEKSPADKNFDGDYVGFKEQYPNVWINHEYSNMEEAFKKDTLLFGQMQEYLSSLPELSDFEKECAKVNRRRPAIFTGCFIFEVGMGMYATDTVDALIEIIHEKIVREEERQAWLSDNLL